jgi:hypothetical protein
MSKRTNTKQVPPKRPAKTVEVELDLGDLKPLLQKAARQSGVSLNEFITDAVESRVRQAREDFNRGQENFTPHGGKHRYGKYSGYEVTENGRYYPAPMWTEQFEQMFAERAAIVNLVNAVIQTAQERLVTVEKALMQTRNRLVEELGLDPNKNWSYHGEDGGYLQEVKADEQSDKGAP